MSSTLDLPETAEELLALREEVAAETLLEWLLLRRTDVVVRGLANALNDGRLRLWLESETWTGEVNDG